MIFIFGGSYQGKLDVAIHKFNLNESSSYDCTQDIDFSYKVLNKFEKYILHLIKQNVNPTDFLKENLYKFQDKIIIMTDISSGVVPVEPLTRYWREECGRCMVIFSKNSCEVYRVFCGIPTKIK